MNNPHKAETIDLPASSQSSALSFFLIAAYLFFEFGRPQETIPGIGLLHLPALMVLLLMLLLATCNKLVLSDRPVKLYIALLILMALHVPFAVNNYWAFHVTRGMAITFIVFLSIITFIDSVKKFESLINIWILIHIYLAIMGILKGGRGIGGFLGDENDFCMTLNMVVPYAYFMARLPSNSFYKRIAYTAVVIIFLFVIMLTFSRGGFIGVLAVGGYCLLKSPRKILSISIIALLILVMSQFAPDKYWDEIKSIQQGSEDSTGSDRLHLWGVGYDMFKDNPVVGVGPGNYPWRISDYEGEKRSRGRSRAGAAAHSLYFTLLPELGLVGVMIFLMMLFHIVKDTTSVRKMQRNRLRENKLDNRLSQIDFKKLAYMSLAIEASLAGYLASGIFISVLYYPNFWVLLGLTIALRKITRQKYNEDCSPSH